MSLEKKHKIHFVGVGGTGTGTLAVALSEKGYEISGSDGKLYEPMKSVLASTGIKLFEGFSRETLNQVKPDSVIIGNVVRRENEEASSWIRSGTPYLSFPQAVRDYVIQDKISVVCAGTHGKTSTTTWTSFLLKELGRDPSYLIGGVPVDLPRGCAITDGKIFVGEGDEYDSAFFDKGPKFLHYNPAYLILSNIEFDHADIYRDLDHVKTSFEKLVALLPGDGLLIARMEDPVVKQVSQGALCPVQTFGLNASGANWRIGKVVTQAEGTDFEILYRNKSVGEFHTRLFGDHNLVNILSGIICAVNLGEPIEKIRPIVPRFQGVRRRQQCLLKEPVFLIDDFAHHPTEVAATLNSVRMRFPSSRIWAFFEPRSATARRATHQEEYFKSFEKADFILLSVPYKNQELSEAERFSPQAVTNKLTEMGKTAQTMGGAQEIIDYFLKNYKTGDVVVVMSNGEFDRIQEKLSKALS